jgi:hypothetical protein
MENKFRLLLIILLMLGAGLWWASRSGERASPAAGPAPPVVTTTKLSLKRPAVAMAPERKQESPPAPPALPASEAAQEIERHKAIDREHLTKLRTGIFAYKAKYGRYPEYLTQLVPEFVTADTLISPRKKAGAQDFADMDHPDPGLETPSYGYEFSNLEFRDGRTFAEIKEVQRAEWGDAIPLLRCFAYGEVLNMAYGGDVYETALNWEWDAATMDLVDKYGWGPGLKSGEMVKVRVTGADGQPVANAQVWADGRNYSFDLPNRPFATDAEGYATIPVGADIDRTSLVLRAEAPGQSSATTRYPAGTLPEGQSMLLGATEPVGGVALDASGQPMANTRIYLKTGGAENAAAAVTSVRTDENGHWQAAVHPQDLPGLSALIGVPGGMPVKFVPGQPLDSAAARAGTAEVRLPAAPP